MPTDTPRPARDLINNINAVKNAGIANAPSAQIVTPARPQGELQKPQVASGTPPTPSEPAPSSSPAPAAPQDPLSMILGKLQGIEDRLSRVEIQKDETAVPVLSTRAPMQEKQRHHGSSMNDGAIVDPSRHIRKNARTSEHGDQIRETLQGMPAEVIVIPNETKTRMRFGDLYFSFQAGVATRVPLAVAQHMVEKKLIAPIEDQRGVTFVPQKGRS